MKSIIRRVSLAGLLSLVVYPLSFAPVDRFFYGDDSTTGTFRTRRLLVFAPVAYLIDCTPADRALLWWSSVWRVDSRHITDRWVRRGQITDSWLPTDEYYGISDDPLAPVAPPSPDDWW